MNKGIKIFLVGLGSEIGSTLLYLLNSNKSQNIRINGILTNGIFKNNIKKNFESILARIVINSPELIDKVRYNEKDSLIIINKEKIKVYWGDVKKYNLSKIKSKYDATIIATSKNHINNKSLMKKFLRISKFVFGVAESDVIPSIYPNLLQTKSKLFEKTQININDIKDKVFALGSCQSNGWQSQLRGIIEVFNSLNLNYQKMLGCEVDIIHPDTPTGRLGTKSINPRDQDARNNFRPGFSQVEKSMKKIFKNPYLKNNVSLRTLISPPGYQISRFYIEYDLKKKNYIQRKYFKEKLINFCNKNKFILNFTPTSLGSRAFQKSEASSILLLDDKYFHFNEDFLNLKSNNNNHKILQIVFQSYVHNTTGYCRSVIETINSVIKNQTLKRKNIFCWK